MAAKQPSELPKAKKHKSMESDEDDEEPENEPGTSSNSQPTAPILLFIKDQQPVHKDQQPVRKDQPQLQFLVTKTVSTATSIVHKVRTLEEQCSVQISTFYLIMSVGQ